MTALKPTTPQEWETLIEHFQLGVPPVLQNHTSASTILDQALTSLLKRDFPLKLPLLHFLDEFSLSLFSTDSHFLRLLDSLRSVLQSPPDGAHLTNHFKEHFMISATSVFISTDALYSFPTRLEGLVEILLTVINRPSHGPDRQTRAVACECLRQLEKAYPCLLSLVAGHIWSLCQGERTHAFQAYLLLFATLVSNIVDFSPNVSVLNTSVPLIPFSLPNWFGSGNGGDVVAVGGGGSGFNFKELRRALAFLLEAPQVLTPCALAEFLSMVVPVAAALDLQVSMLRVQFFGMVYSFDPLLCHVVLTLCLRFSDVFDGKRGEIFRRLMLITKESQHYLVFRLLALHWLMGWLSESMSSGEVGKCKDVVEMGLRFYPAVFDPLALKALKLDLLALWSICRDTLKAESSVVDEPGAGKSVAKIFEDGLVSVSAFRWLPYWSTETAVAFRSFHKFAIGASCHTDDDPSTTRILMDSTSFQSLQKMMVETTLGFQRIVPVTVSFIDRLLGCKKHQWLGERLLQAIDEHLLPKVKINHKLASFFPLFDRVAENQTVPPRGLLDLLIKYMDFLVEKHGPETGIKSWSQGSNVLGICRTMLVHHHSSRLFLRLTRLLAFTCLFFPDLEVRDTARIYLRMLVCVPGLKLRSLLSLSEQLLGITPSPHSSSFFNVQSPRKQVDSRKSRNISSYIHLERRSPLLVKQCWSLSLSPSSAGDFKPIYPECIIDGEPSLDIREVNDSTFQSSNSGERMNQHQEPLRVMDSKLSKILGILRVHFSCIPDLSHTPGLSIRISCSLRFESEPFARIWGSSQLDDASDSLPAIYATVLKFASSAPYGPIPPYRIPFLLGEPSRDDHASDVAGSADIVPVEAGSEDEEGEENFRALVTIELVPREPTPGFIDASIETNTDWGQIIRGQLQSIMVGIEDMFQKAIVPSEIPEVDTTYYYSELFDALWEACGASSNIGQETFPLKGGKGVAAISGTRSVKLLEAHSKSIIQAVERYLEPFIVSVIGEQLVNLVKDRGIISNVMWKDAVPDSYIDGTAPIRDLSRGPLHLTYIDDQSEGPSQFNIVNRTMGQFLVLIFLPPRFHLLFQMEVSEVSTLVRIRTDHWPCLAYVDDYLEALILA